MMLDGRTGTYISIPFIEVFHANIFIYIHASSESSLLTKIIVSMNRISSKKRDCSSGDDVNETSAPVLVVHCMP